MTNLNRTRSDLRRYSDANAGVRSAQGLCRWREACPYLFTTQLSTWLLAFENFFFEYPGYAIDQKIRVRRDDEVNDSTYLELGQQPVSLCGALEVIYPPESEHHLSIFNFILG